MIPSASCGLPILVCSERLICQSARVRCSPAAAASCAAAGSSPCAQSRKPGRACLLDHGTAEGDPEALAPPAGIDHHFPGRALDWVGRIQVTVASQVAVLAEQQVAGPRIAPVSQMQHDVLR